MHYLISEFPLGRKIRASEGDLAWVQFRLRLLNFVPAMFASLRKQPVFEPKCLVLSYDSVGQGRKKAMGSGGTVQYPTFL